MKLNDRELKNHYKAHVRTKSSGSRKKCPSRTDLAKAFDSATSEKQKTRIINHLSECTHCAGEFEILRQIFKASQDMGREVDGILTKESGSKVPISRYLTWAASIAIVVTGIVMISRWPESLFHEHGVRGPEETKIELLEPGAGSQVRKRIKSQPGDFLRFNWNKYAEAEYYVLKLYNETLILLFESKKIPDNQWTLPPEIFEKLRKNNTYFWMVTAYSGSEKKAESDLQSFKLIIQ